MAANPTVRVSPTGEVVSHDVALMDGTETLGLQFYDELVTNILQEVPISPPSRPYSTRQKSWFGGSRKNNFKDDPNGFYESYAMWNTTEGKLFPRPIERFATGHRDQEQNQPGSVQWVQMTGANSRQYISQSFTASATTDRRYIWLILNYVGAPGALTVGIYTNSAGNPGVLQQETTVTAATVNTYGWAMLLLPANVAVTKGTTYHIRLNCAATDGPANHWEIGMQASNGAKRSTDGTNWTLMAYTLYYRVTDASTKRQWFHFNLYGAEYKVSNNDANSGSVLMINGDRGKSTGAGTSTTLVDTGTGVATWDTDEWVGCKIRILNGAGDGQIRTITGNTNTGTITVSPAWDVTPDATSEYVIYDTPLWQVIGTTGLTECKSRPVVAHNIVYFPQGSTNIRVMHVDYTAASVHAFADDGTNKAGAMEVFYDPDKGLQLWKAIYGSASLSYATPASWGVPTAYTAIAGNSVGTSDENITNILGREALYVWKEHSLWKIVRGRPVQLNSGMEYSSSPYNGKAAVASTNEMWWGWSHSLVRMIGGTISDMMAFRQGWQGLPSDRQGTAVSGVNAGAWWFFAMDGRFSDRSTILVWNGQGFSEFFRGWATSQRIQNVYWLMGPEARPKLYFDCGGDSMYIEFPLNNSNPLNDTSLSFQWFSELVTTTFDADEPALEKALARISALIYGGGRKIWNGRVKLYFQVDDEIDPVARRPNATWHLIGEMRGPKKVGKVKAQEFDINYGGVNRYRFKIEIYSTSATQPLVLLGIEHFGDIFIPLQYRWVGTFKVDSNQITKSGDPDFQPDFVLDFLRRAYEQGKVLQMRSVIKNMDTRAVVIANAPVPVYQWVRAEDGQAKWGGYITIGLKEPG